MGKTGRNEIRKITAAYLNGIAVALFVGGAVLPAITGLGGAHGRQAVLFATVTAISLALHFSARLMVEHLED